MKFLLSNTLCSAIQVAPFVGAGIEISLILVNAHSASVAPFVGAGIEIDRIQ